MPHCPSTASAGPAAPAGDPSSVLERYRASYPTFDAQALAALIEEHPALRFTLLREGAKQLLTEAAWQTPKMKSPTRWE